MKSRNISVLKYLIAVWMLLFPLELFAGFFPSSAFKSVAIAQFSKELPASVAPLRSNMRGIITSDIGPSLGALAAAGLHRGDLVVPAVPFGELSKEDTYLIGVGDTFLNTISKELGIGFKPTRTTHFQVKEFEEKVIWGVAKIISMVDSSSRMPSNKLRDEVLPVYLALVKMIAGMPEFIWSKGNALGKIGDPEHSQPADVQRYFQALFLTMRTACHITDPAKYPAETDVKEIVASLDRLATSEFKHSMIQVTGQGNFREQAETNGRLLEDISLSLKRSIMRISYILGPEMEEANRAPLEGLVKMFARALWRIGGMERPDRDRIVSDPLGYLGSLSMEDSQGL